MMTHAENTVQHFSKDANMPISIPGDATDAGLRDVLSAGAVGGVLDVNRIV